MRERRTPQARQPRSDAAGQRPDKHRASVDSNTLEEQCHPRKVFIGGLAHKTTTQHLREHFGRYGSIVDAVVLRWPDGRSRGFGYVTFADVASAAGVLKESHQLSGREVDVKRAVPGTNKLFIGGLPQNTTANELREHFEKFGVVSDAVVMIDPATGRSRGFGFVCYLPGQEGASAVMDALQQYENHRIRGKWIEVKSAAPPHKLAAKGGSGGQEVDLALSEVGANVPSTKEGCELSLAGALQHCHGGPLATPFADPHEAHQGGLGSPLKVNIGPSVGNAAAAAPPQHQPHARQDFGSAMRGHALQAAPPGLEAPLLDDPRLMWPPNPWQSSYAGAPPPSGFHLPPMLPQSSLATSESLQRNLEEFVRQSLQSKMEMGAGKGTPSVSTTCSATQTEAGTTYTAEI